MTLPQVVRDQALPQRVTIYEVGPRDGLQNEQNIVPTATKADFICRLVEAGLPVVESTSFVHPRWVPQLADAEDLVDLLVDRLGEPAKDMPVLVPNERGLDRALEKGVRHVAIFGSATETFAQRNLNRSLDEQFSMFEPTVARAREAGSDVRAYVSMCFGDPWEGAVPVDQVVSVGKRLFDLGASQLSLGDTIGTGTAAHVTALLAAFNEAGVPNEALAVHFHDTYGQALSNAAAALRCGITTFDASAGGLGGCSASSTASTSRHSSRPHAGWPASSAGPARAPWCGHCPTPTRPSDQVGQTSRMSRVVYLHVGAPKTGTTYLQDRLALNKPLLARHGVHYPLGVHASHFRPALDLLEMPWGGIHLEVDGEWDGLMNRVRRQSGKVVVSHEILAAAKTAQVKRAMAALRGAEVHLVYSARDLARQIPAEWQEGIKHQRKRGFAGFLTAVQSERRSKPNLWFWRVQSLPDVLSRWSRGLPPERVHLVTVPQAGAPRDLLWTRYCQAFDIDPSWAPEESARENVSIGAAETTLIRKLNRRLKRAGLPSEEYRRLIRELVVHQTLAQRPDMTRVTLPPTAFPWAEEVAEEWIEWVEGSGIDVIGDVQDLRPVRPDPDAPWANPDRPRRPEMVDAALDAMVALALEASRRPDPDDQISAKIGRAARRLRRQ
jgi:hypothetical protein